MGKYASAGDSALCGYNEDIKASSLGCRVACTDCDAVVDIDGSLKFCRTTASEKAAIPGIE